MHSTPQNDSSRCPSNRSEPRGTDLRLVTLSDADRGRDNGRKGAVKKRRSSRQGEETMGLEIVYFLGALVLLTALIYASLSFHYRNKSATRVGDEIARDRYRRNET